MLGSNPRRRAHSRCRVIFRPRWSKAERLPKSTQVAQFRQVPLDAALTWAPRLTRSESDRTKIAQAKEEAAWRITFATL